MSRPMEGTRPRLVDSHMRVVLTPEVAKALRVRPGDHVAFVLEGDEVRVRKVRLALE